MKLCLNESSRIICNFKANWAQASGEIQQNVVIPYYPSFKNAHWGSRYGFVSIVIPPQGQSVGFVFLLGGDTYDGSKTSKKLKNGLVDSRWETGYKNDIWRMAGTEWLAKGDSRLRAYHQKIPQVTSQLKWQLITRGNHPPPRTTYDKWLECEDYFRNLNVSRFIFFCLQYVVPALSFSKCEGEQHLRE